MIKMAVMGYGVVGSGVYRAVREGTAKIAEYLGEELDIKYILDIRDFDDHPEKELFVKDAKIIAQDGEISIVAETMGGVSFAFEYTKMMLEAGKSVVTSNKELVSKKGTELFAIAREHNAAYMFEAAVGGGIPLIDPFVNCLCANEIKEIHGILNGTTNYILTKMFKEGQPFEAALADAQRLGYAEKDPSADVDGFDTLRKISILTALAFGSDIDDGKIPVEGIRSITDEDVKYASEAGFAIKLIGSSFTDGKRVFARVSPMLVPHESPLAHVDDVNNGVVVTGSMTGDVMFYGKGAGKMATASAITADVMAVARRGGFDSHFSWAKERENSFIPEEETQSRFFVRCAAAAGEIEKAFGSVDFIDEGVFITPMINEKEFSLKAKSLGVISKIRVYEVKE